MNGGTWKWTSKSYAAEYCELSAGLRRLAQPKLLMSVLRPTGKEDRRWFENRLEIPYSMLKAYRPFEGWRSPHTARRRFRSACVGCGGGLAREHGVSPTAQALAFGACPS